MSSEPNYVVVRPSPDLPPGFLPEHLDGKWFDISEMPFSFREPGEAAAAGIGEAVSVPTGRFEYRDDGAVAEVYEVRP